MFFFRLAADLLAAISNQLALSLALLLFSIWLILEIKPQPLSCYLIIGAATAINLKALAAWAKAPTPRRSSRTGDVKSQKLRPLNKF